MQCKLYITATGYLQFIDNVQCGGTQHLILFIAQGLRGRYYNTVTGMHTYWVNVFHVTYGDTVARGIAHHLILDLLPTRDTALHKHLSHAA